MDDFQTLLDYSSKIHGHLCPGQVLGVRMSMLGLKRIGIDDPKGRDRKSLIVFVEMDRCAADAVQSVTGCTLGHRSLKFLDYGKMAATFLNTRTGQATRVLAKEESRERAKCLFPDIEDKYAAQLEAYKVMTDEDLFDVMEVKVELRPEDMPGRPLGRVRCEQCGETVQDRREVLRDGRAFCRACGGAGYYTPVHGDFFSPPVMQTPHNGNGGGLSIRSKLWVETDGKPIFGRGRRQLLEAIDRFGSINQAAKEIQISYRKAWGYIQAMEERLGIKLIERTTGGRNGGGATITPEARDFLERFDRLESGVREMVDDRFRQTFGSQNH